MAQPSISLPLFVAAEDRRRFFLQAGKAAEKFAVKLIKPYAGNLVSYFLVKGKEEAARAYIHHMVDFLQAKKSLRIPVQILVDLQPLVKPKQAPGIWLEMPSKEEASKSCGLVGEAKDRALMLKKLGEIEGQVCSSEIASPGIALAHHGMVIGKGDARIKHIHEKYDMRVRFPKDRESPITVSGKSVSVHRAIKELEELVQQDLLKQRLFLPVNILPEDLGVASGKGGCHAAKIQAEFGVRLRTKSHEHPDSPLLEVEGPLSAAAKAVASIESHDPERRRLNDEHAERS